MSFDPQSIRRQFPILEQKVDGKPLVYLDSAATAQKPLAVLEAMDAYLRTQNANPHRGMHPLAESATLALESSRKTVAEFLHAHRPEEVIFTKSCTEAINLVAKSWAKKHMKKGDAVVLSLLEHHSNIVPWLQLKEEIGIAVEWIDIDEEGHLKLEQLEQFLKSGSVKLVSVTAQSNVLGIRTPLEEIIRMAHAAGARVLVDAAQLVAHGPVDVQRMDCDFLAFSSHKLYGPTGIGVLYGKRGHLESMPALMGGGGMVREVTTEQFTEADIPAKFEGGSPATAEVVGLAAAIEWLTQFDWNDIEKHEQSLLRTAHEELSAIKGVTILGPKNPRELHGCLSFIVDGTHPHDLTDALGKQGVCLRAGHHCAQPLYKRLGHGATTRLSVGIHTTQEELSTLHRVLSSIRQ